VTQVHNNGRVPIPTVNAAAVDANAYLLDVREPNEWHVGHVEGSVHIPMNELPGRIGELPAGEPIVVICRVGGRSAQVTAWLTAQGYDAANLSGGLIEWAAVPRPLVTDSGALGTVA